MSKQSKRSNPMHLATSIWAPRSTVYLTTGRGEINYNSCLSSPSCDYATYHLSMVSKTDLQGNRVPKFRVCTRALHWFTVRTTKSPQKGTHSKHPGETRAKDELTLRLLRQAIRTYLKFWCMIAHVFTSCKWHHSRSHPSFWSNSSHCSTTVQRCGAEQWAAYKNYVTSYPDKDRTRGSCTYWDFKTTLSSWARTIWPHRPIPLPTDTRSPVKCWCRLSRSRWNTE